MNHANVQSVQKTIVVNAPLARAFKVFTEGLDKWWPRSHKIGQAALQRAVLEPRAGGRWYEVGEDGAQCEWGKVLVYEPPHRLVLAWQINALWQFDGTLVTEVEVKFIAEDEKRTRVELEHRNLERFGAHAAEIRKTFESEQGWGGILEGFSRAVTGV